MVDASDVDPKTGEISNEPSRLASTYDGDPRREYLQFYELGVDGVFSEFPDTAVAARETYHRAAREDP